MIVTICHNPHDSAYLRKEKVYVSRWAETIVTIQSPDLDNGALRLVSPSEYIEAKGDTVRESDGYVKFINDPPELELQEGRAIDVKNANTIEGKVRIYLYTPVDCGGCIQKMKNINWWDKTYYTNANFQLKTYTAAELLAWEQRAKQITG